MSAGPGAEGEPGARPRWRDPRVWLGLGVTLLFLWLALRDVDTREVGRAIARADWLLLVAGSLPSYVILVWLRALRWQHLTEPIQPISTGALYRAVSVGFMANNVFPLRMGEVVRAWYLSRESGASTAALFGTVILERAIDTVSVLLLVLLVLGGWGAGGQGELERGALVLVPVAFLPIAALFLLRSAPDRVIALAHFFLRPFPRRVSHFVEDLLRRFTEGLGALSGGSHLVWITVHSMLIWLVFSAVPIIVVFAAMDLPLGPPIDMLGAAWMTQAAIGVAVALPSAPGFFGIFHWACKLALLRFGIAPDEAVAAGTLIHGVMWVTLTSMGLAVLRFRRTTLHDVDEAAASETASKGPPASRR
ncbi:MAG: lysylphosphatidylglycerol synthase transmembrane domain-containing protein [Myxococcota bacterium]|nr:lysylphosphatidylglycerol synthase transmembrane domain-containing protein [Myxococcota bacterium]